MYSEALDRPLATSCSRSAGIGKLQQGGCNGMGILAIDEQRSVTGDLWNRQGVSGDDRAAKAHGFEQRHAESLEERWIEEAVGLCVQPG